MSCLDDLKNNPMVLYPPSSGDIFHRSQEPIIFLAGSTTGILIQKTWHCSMIEQLHHFGYVGKVYIPCQLETALSDSDSELHLSTLEKNNSYMEKKSFAIVYWGGETHESSSMKHLLHLVWTSSKFSNSGIRRPLFFFGAHEGSRARDEFDQLSVHIRIYTRLSQIASDVVDKVNLLVV